MSASAPAGMGVVAGTRITTVTNVGPGVTLVTLPTGRPRTSTALPG